jgi:uncharacterized protein (DUF924 family)
VNAADDVLRFWFEELRPEQWWRVDSALDELIRTRFASLHRGVVRGDHYAWRVTPAGRLAEVVVLDQFSRNMYRGSAAAFASDGLALTLAQAAVAAGADRALAPVRRAFLYLPYMHSESLAVHEQAVVLFSQPGLEYNLDFERKHKSIIERFGRYPHRNAALGRTSTAEEAEFLKTAGSSF